MKNSDLLSSFKNAFNGLKNTFIYEKNFKIHVFAALCVMLASYLLKIDILSFSAVVLAICTVLTAELINTAIEAMVDLFCGDKFSPYAKIAKDAAAAAVLVSSVFAVIIGVLVFGKKIIDIF